jgi:hypothetical protein
MPGTFSYVAATHRAIITDGGAGPAADRSHAAPLPAAQAAANNLSLAGEVGQGASRGGSQAAGRMFS